MQTEIQFGGIGLSVILTITLAVIYKIFDNRIPDKYRAGIAVVLGVGLGLLNIPYSALACTITCVIDNSIHGFMIGASAVGLYELQRTATNPRQ